MKMHASNKADEHEYLLRSGEQSMLWFPNVSQYW